MFNSLKYKPGTYFNPQHNSQKFVIAEKEVQKLVAYRLQSKPSIVRTGEWFILNNFLRKMRPNEDVQAILKRIYGIGDYRSRSFVTPFTYFTGSLTFKNLTAMHLEYISHLIENLNWSLKGNLRDIQKHNITHYKTINCYRGTRHSLYLPVHGQRTHSNAHVARYRSSGTFEYVPRRPSTKLKKLSKYSRRKKFILDASNARYKRLVNKYYVEFTKTNKHLFKYLAKKNKLGIYSKIFKDKQKMAKAKLKSKNK